MVGTAGGNLQTTNLVRLSFTGVLAELPRSFQLVPVRLVWVLMGKTDAYIAALEHESFHAYEGMLAVHQLGAAESMYAVEEKYPFDAMEEPWKREMDVLVQAARAEENAARRDLVKRFLQMRADRRAGLSPEEVDLERLREWEEGLAKYAELEIRRQAGTDAGYRPVDEVVRRSDFKNYAGEQQFWLGQLQEAKSTQGRSGDTRFYYSGNAMAVVLDRLSPGWKERALPGGEYLDDLLQEAVK
jgi:hypothetical protein